MGEFSAEWLALREPADEAARSRSVTSALVDRLAGRSSLNIVDLGTGTGSNVRYLAERLRLNQQWLLVDGDALLVDQILQRLSSWSVARGYHVAQQGHDLRIRSSAVEWSLAPRCLDLRAMPADLLGDRDLVTASALLDLVSDDWLRLLAAGCARAGAAVLFALTYDGRIECLPHHPDDEAVRELVNRHQQTDKGFGAALGPLATDRLQMELDRQGYQVIRGSSDWVLDEREQELQRQLVEGWASAAVAMDGSRAQSIEGWRVARLASIDEGRSRITVGHQDLAGWRPLRPL